MVGFSIDKYRQQSQLVNDGRMPFDLLDPNPDNGDSSLAIGQTDNQQLMPKANPGGIYDQMNLAQMPELAFQPLPAMEVYHSITQCGSSTPSSFVRCQGSARQSYVLG